MATKKKTTEEENSNEFNIDKVAKNYAKQPRENHDMLIDIKKSYALSLKFCKTDEQIEHLESVIDSGNFKKDR